MEAIKELSVIEPTSKTEKEVEELVKDWGNDREKLIMAMLAVQDKYNWLPPDALDYISRRFNIPKGHIYHIATFYKVFSLVPRGKHILQLCMGTACHVRPPDAAAHRALPPTRSPHPQRAGGDENHGGGRVARTGRVRNLSLIHI